MFDRAARSRSARDGQVAVLTSGGIDSAILCVDLLEDFTRVHPVYVRFGLRWEEVELTSLRNFLKTAGAEASRAGLLLPHVLEEPIADVYGVDHWSTRGRDVP